MIVYILRDVSNNIISYSSEPTANFETIDDQDQEFIDFIAAIDTTAALRSGWGFQKKRHENLCKLYIIELAKKDKDDLTLPQALIDSAQAVIDNVT